MSQARDILHVDMDAFFVSVERVLDPALRGRPVIVGGDVSERSVVASASYEARRYGVRSAMPMALARRRCPQAVVLRGNFAAYVEFSRRVHEILLRFTPLVQAVSLDDFYLDMTGCRRLYGPPLTAAERTKLTVRAETGLDVSIGAANNKVTAKVASGFAKPNGIVSVLPGCEAAFLRPLPVEKLPGVGPSTAAMLRKFNLRTVADLAHMPRALLERTFGQTGVDLWERANGRDSSPVVPDRGLPRSIGREHTFKEDTLDGKRIHAMLYALTERAARQLREEGLGARRVTVKVRYCNFRTVTAARSLSAPTDQDHLFYEAAQERLERLMTRGLRVRLIGITLSGLHSAVGRQGNLFDEETQRRRNRFYSGLDRLRERFGFHIAHVGPSLRLLPQSGGEEEQPRHGQVVQ